MDQVQALLDVLTRAAKEVGQKHNSAGTPISTGYSHGPGGNLTFPGVDPTVFQTIVGSSGLLGMLPAMPSSYTNPTYQVITGVKADTGSEKTNVCDDAPVAGLAKGGIITSVFGRYERSTPELEINRLGARSDRADPLDLALVGTPIAQGGLFGTGNADPSIPADVLTNEISRKFWERNIALYRLLARQMWRGNPTNNTAGGGYMEMTGLNVLVNTGYKDAQTGTLLPSVDSQVLDFGSKVITTSPNGDALVNTLAYLLHYLESLANDTGVTPVRWVIAMRKEMFFEVTKVWPCAYMTTGCQVATGATQFVDATEQIRMRDEMRAGKYLMVLGERIDVVLDDGISFDTNTTSSGVASGNIRSDIFVLPMSVVGGRSTLYLEYFDFTNPSINSALSGNDMILGRVEGAFLTVPRQKNFCVQWQTKIEPRLVLRTPWLAGRIKNVTAAPALIPRQSFPDNPYFVNGGEVTRQGPSYFHIW